MKTYDEVLAVMSILDGMDGFNEGVWWCVRNVKNGDATQPEIKCYVNANDLFYWATADCEEITIDDISLLKETIADCEAIDQDEYWYELFAARKRKMRPQRPCYKFWSLELSALFDACGPEQGNRG